MGGRSRSGCIFRDRIVFVWESVLCFWVFWGRIYRGYIDLSYFVFGMCKEDGF